MSKPVQIFIDGQELTGYTDMRLKRAKENMTGELSFSVFMGWIPEEPFLKQATKGRQVLVYIARQLAFTGIIDRRRDTADSEGAAGTTRGESEGSTQSLSVGPTEYTIRFTCRGNTKFLVDSSHQHPTGTMLLPTSRDVINTLVAPWGVEVEWRADDEKLDKIRFRDGGIVSQEIYRLAESNALYVHETRDGKLRISDGPGETQGEDIILGRNILSFSTDQAEDQERSEVLVKGQRIEKTSWGNPAVIPGISVARDENTTTRSKTTVQLYGNSTPLLLNKRIQYETNRRNAASRKIELKVFHIQQSSGQPWDIGDLHFVSIPPAGIKGIFEITNLEYTINADRTLETSLTLSPPPSKYQEANDSGTILAGAENSTSGDPSEWEAAYARNLEAERARAVNYTPAPENGTSVDFLGPISNNTPPLTSGGGPS